MGACGWPHLFYQVAKPDQAEVECMRYYDGYMLIANPGYVNMYDGNGNFVKSFDIGEKPIAISYSYGTVKYNSK